MKSSFSNPTGNCIDVEEKDGLIKISETDPPKFGFDRLYTTKDNFAAFIAGVKDGEFDHLIQTEAAE